MARRKKEDNGTPEVKKEVVQRYVRRDNINKRLQQGWKVVNEKAVDDRNRFDAAKIYASDDLVLMEKEK